MASRARVELVERRQLRFTRVRKIDNRTVDMWTLDARSIKLPTHTAVLSAKPIVSKWFTAKRRGALYFAPRDFSLRAAYAWAQ
jgi:hypothetical protein